MSIGFHCILFFFGTLFMCTLGTRLVAKVLRIPHYDV